MLRRRLDLDEFLGRSARRMIPGARLESAAPVRPVSGPGDIVPVTQTRLVCVFDFDGPLYVVTTGPWRFLGDENVFTLLGTVASPGSTDTVMQLLKNGSVAGSVTVPAGSQLADAAISASFSSSDIAQGRMITPGVGASDASLEAVA